MLSKMSSFYKKKLVAPKTGKNAHPLQIVATNDKHMFVLDEDSLNSVLLQDNVKDREIVVVSVAGGFRKGKSFLLDFVLRYLYSKYVYHSGTNWLGEENEPLSGFSWRGGSERDTTGILMWSEIFLFDYPTGEKVAIILLDTQGAFDSQSTVRASATIFAMSTMLSSVQIFNISQNLQENDLQHLQLFIEYGRLALDQSVRKPFQHLQFVVRDWSCPYEAEYGAIGGRTILNKRLKITENQHQELQFVRRHITSCFTSIECFLMPHPGLFVSTNPNFDGRLSDIDVAFKSRLKELIPMLLAPENLIKKEINGEKVKARDLPQYFKSYLAMYKGNKLPEPKSVLQATAEANNLAAIATAKELYLQLMINLCGGTKPYRSPDYLESEHLRIKDQAIQNFAAKLKMGGEEFSAMYREQLISDLDDRFASFRSYNEGKNIFKAVLTLAVFLAISVVIYIFSVIFALVGLDTVARICNILMGIPFLMLLLWAYIRYRGGMSYFGTCLDKLFNSIRGLCCGAVAEEDETNEINEETSELIQSKNIKSVSKMTKYSGAMVKLVNKTASKTQPDVFESFASTVAAQLQEIHKLDASEAFRTMMDIQILIGNKLTTNLISPKILNSSSPPKPDHCIVDM